MSQTQQTLTSTTEAQEIDDQSLDQVVGGALCTNELIIDSTEEGLKKQPTKTASFGGEDWQRK